MIAGRFSSRHPRSALPALTPIPVLEALLWLPAIDVDVRVEFLVDTGADITVLHPIDSSELLRRPSHWDFVRSQRSMKLRGAGQSLPYYAVDAVISFVHDDGRLDSTDFTLHIGEPDAATADLESLLGRDVLRYFTTTFRQLDSITLERAS